jgi:hypothetical protein
MLINQIYEDKKNYIEENFDEFIGSLPLSRKALERRLDTDVDDEKIKHIKENIKLLLYNSRKMVCDNGFGTSETENKLKIKCRNQKKIIKID